MLRARQEACDEKFLRLVSRDAGADSSLAARRDKCSDQQRGERTSILEGMDYIKSK
jgi:hypothetical protein